MISILTPTYNRAKTLSALFDSLMKQTCKSFEWIVIDDGSTDDTRSLMRSLEEKADFPLKYIHKQNGGRHTAVNLGVQEAVFELSFPVDSDDTLAPDAVEQILDCYNKYKGNPKIGVYSFSRCDSRNNLELALPRPETVSDYIEFRIRGKRPGNMAEVFKTEVLRKYPFPTFENERFLSEDVLWIEIAKEYDSVFLDKGIYVSEYLSDGLTANDKNVKFGSPLGSMLRGKQLMYSGCGLRENLRGAIIYNCYRNEVKGALPECLRVNNLGNMLLLLITRPLGSYYNRKWKRSV